MLTPPRFRDLALEDITAAAIDESRAGLPALSPRTKNKLLVVTHGVMGGAAQVWGLPANAVAGVKRHRQRSTGDLEVFSPEEVMALVRAAASDQDSAIYLTAAFTGLRRGGADRAALARCRLPGLADTGADELQRRRAHLTEVGKGPLSADGA